MLIKLPILSIKDNKNTDTEYLTDIGIDTPKITEIIDDVLFNVDYIFRINRDGDFNCSIIWVGLHTPPTSYITTLSMDELKLKLNVSKSFIEIPIRLLKNDINDDLDEIEKLGLDIPEYPEVIESNLININNILMIQESSFYSGETEIWLDVDVFIISPMDINSIHNLINKI